MTFELEMMLRGIYKPPFHYHKWRKLTSYYHETPKLVCKICGQELGYISLMNMKPVERIKIMADSEKE